MPAAPRAARRLVAVARNRRDFSSRQVPRLSVGPPSGEPTVYYLCPDDNSAIGGIRVIYRHVDTLNAAGVSAAVVHKRTGFRCTWFANRTRVVGAPEARLSERDLLVVPEYYGAGLHALPPGIRVVILNQNAYRTFEVVDRASTPSGAPYRAVPGIQGILVVSRDNADVLAYTFPDIPVHLARPVVDGTIFHPAPKPAGKSIAYVASRRAHEREQLLHMLRARGVLDGWRVQEIGGRSEVETAALMRSSAVFLSFSEHEGFGLPPAEAMASGSYVVGYPGLAGREYFDPSYSTPVPEDDILAFARAVEEATQAYVDDPSFGKRGLVASEHILAHYSQSGLREDLLTFFRPLL